MQGGKKEKRERERKKMPQDTSQLVDIYLFAAAAASKVSLLPSCRYLERAAIARLVELFFARP